MEVQRKFCGSQADHAYPTAHVVKGGNAHLPRRTTTLYRNELFTRNEPYGSHVNVTRTPALNARARKEAVASTRYKRNRVSRADLLKTRKGLRPVRAGVTKNNKVNRHKTDNTPSRKFMKSVLRAYSGVTAPSEKTRFELCSPI